MCVGVCIKGCERTTRVAILLVSYHHLIQGHSTNERCRQPDALPRLSLPAVADLHVFIDVHNDIDDSQHCPKMMEPGGRAAQTGRESPMTPWLVVTNIDVNRRIFTRLSTVDTAHRPPALSSRKISVKTYLRVGPAPAACSECTSQRVAALYGRTPGRPRMLHAAWSS
ncbi:hypothetical protein MKEN_00762600 [Mycena kentingensis (nom. inval.)]|nr:hypothetical protein MKEN_00762600 [Mycena kentingensis (nom. inval.)]